MASLDGLPCSLDALCAHPMMSQDVPPDEHFETISARNIYIQTRRAATPATPPPITTPTPARSRSRAPPPNPLLLLPDTSTSTSTPWMTSSRGSTPSTLSSALDRPLDGRGLLHGHLWQATRHRTPPPVATPADSAEVPSPPPPAPSS